LKCLAFPELVDYWFAELPAAREAEVEEHFLGCARCSARLEELVRLGGGIRASFRRGAFGAVISHPMLEKMKIEGLRLREYRVAPGASVQCTIARDDDFVVSRLAAPLAGVERLDLVADEGGVQHRVVDIPFDPASGEVLFVPPAAALKNSPAFVSRVRLVAHEGGVERALGEYTFNHTPS
jgi:anti-sigma factor RsiW